MACLNCGTGNCGCGNCDNKKDKKGIDKIFKKYSREKEEVNKWLDENMDYAPDKVKTKGVIYIMGPMRGYDNLNFDAFYKAEEFLKKEGWVVHNPARTPMGLKSPKAYIMIDMAMIYECDALFRLNGWEKSKGACLENALAEFLDLDIYDE